MKIKLLYFFFLLLFSSFGASAQTYSAAMAQCQAELANVNIPGQPATNDCVDNYPAPYPFVILRDLSTGLPNQNVGNAVFYFDFASYTPPNPTPTPTGSCVASNSKFWAPELAFCKLKEDGLLMIEAYAWPVIIVIFFAFVIIRFFKRSAKTVS